MARQLEDLAARLAGARAAAAAPRDTLPLVYGWLLRVLTPTGLRRVKCLLDSGALHCFQ